MRYMAPWPGIEPMSPVLEGEVLTSGPSEKSQGLDEKIFGAKIKGPSQ